MKGRYAWFILFFLIVIQICAAEEVFKGFEYIRVFSVDHQGNMYTNYGEHSIAKYSPKGALLLKMGQKGEGPGDIKRLVWFTIHPSGNTIFVTEGFNGNKWISTFSTSGKYLGEWKSEFDCHKWNSIGTIAFDQSGNIYLQATKSYPRRHKAFTIGTHETVLFKFSEDGKKLKRLYSIKNDFEAYKNGKGNVTIPFHNYLFWKVYGEKVVVRESKGDFISVFDKDGNLEKKIGLPFKKQKVTEEDINRWYDHMSSLKWVKRGIAQGWYDLKYWKRNLSFPEHKQISWYPLFIDENGFLYSCKAWDNKSKLKTWARINLSDYQVSLVYSLAEESLLNISGSSFYITRPFPEEDEHYVVKTDKADFFKDKALRIAEKR